MSVNIHKRSAYLVIRRVDHPSQDQETIRLKAGDAETQFEVLNVGSKPAVIQSVRATRRLQIYVTEACSEHVLQAGQHCIVTSSSIAKRVDKPFVGRLAINYNTASKSVKQVTTVEVLDVWRKIQAQPPGVNDDIYNTFHDGSKIYAVDDNGLYQLSSLSNSATWTQVLTNNNDADIQATAIADVALFNNHSYYAIDDSGIYEQTAQGEWSQLSNAYSYSNFAIFGGNLYAGASAAETGGVLMRSATQTWQQSIGNSGYSFGPIDAANGTLYAVGWLNSAPDNGLFTLFELSGQNTWRKVAALNVQVENMGVLNNTLYVVVNDGDGWTLQKLDSQGHVSLALLGFPMDLGKLVEFGNDLCAYNTVSVVCYDVSATTNTAVTLDAGFPTPVTTIYHLFRVPAETQGGNAHLVAATNTNLYSLTVPTQDTN